MHITIGRRPKLWSLITVFSPLKDIYFPSTIQQFNNYLHNSRTMTNHPLLLILVGCLLGLFDSTVLATGPLNGLPILNGPVPTVPKFRGMKTRVGDFVHPGLWHTHDDLERIRDGVLNGLEPWKSTYANFSADPFSQANVNNPPTAVFIS